VRPLERLSALSGALAALCLSAIAVIVLAQIASRPLGLKLVGADDFAAWAMAAAAFLALPQALVKGDHIRVSLVVQLLPPVAARVVGGFAELLGLLLSAWSAWSVCLFVQTSWRMHDVSQGELAAPLWVPQLSMLFGFVLLAAVFAGRFARTMSGKPVDGPMPDEAPRTE
jgi:TRAP-type C4-dicarboxylate transport system permease small subunit